jgi:hypothetical protein
MSWTHEELTKLGYILHKDGQYYPNNHPPKLPDPIPKHDPVVPLVKPPQTQNKGKRRIDLRIERVSTKLQDFDNFVGGTKPLTDQLRYLGVIPEDDPASISASYHQQRCKHRKDEKTIIHVTYHTPKPRETS